MFMIVELARLVGWWLAGDAKLDKGKEEGRITESREIKVFRIVSSHISLKVW
jgi:hypothetical protein